jgi:hypothetical protein
VTVGDRPSCALLSAHSVRSLNLFRHCASSGPTNWDPETEAFRMHGKYPLVSQYCENSVYDVGLG